MNTSSLWSDRVPARLRIRRPALVAVLAFAVAGCGWAQSNPLVAYPAIDPAIYAASVGMVLSSYALEALKPKPDIANLSISDIPRFDRLFYRTHRSESLSIASDATVAGTALIPFILVPQMSRSELISSGVVYGESLGLSYGLKSILKGLIVRYRPYAYAPSKSPAILKDPELEDSFPSGHVTVAFAAAVTTGYLFDLYNRNTAARAAVWTSSLGLATATAILRVWSGNHFLSDVIAAAAIGSFVGFIVPFAHNPASLQAVGLSPAIKSLVPSTGVPIVQWNLTLP